jgi:hypothetical protein
MMKVLGSLFTEKLAQFLRFFRVTTSAEKER